MITRVLTRRHDTNEIIVGIWWYGKNDNNNNNKRSMGYISFHGACNIRALPIGICLNLIFVHCSGRVLYSGDVNRTIISGENHNLLRQSIAARGGDGGSRFDRQFGKHFSQWYTVLVNTIAVTIRNSESENSP